MDQGGDPNMCMNMSVMGKINRLTGSAVRFLVYNDPIKASSGWDLNPRHAVMSVKGAAVWAESGFEGPSQHSLPACRGFKSHLEGAFTESL